jgi:hypothetical protein
MNKLAETLLDVRRRIAQANPEIAESIDNSLNDINTNPMVDTTMNPQIETFAKPKTSVSLVEDNGTIHSFSVEIKASKNAYDMMKVKYDNRSDFYKYIDWVVYPKPEGGWELVKLK